MSRNIGSGRSRGPYRIENFDKRSERSCPPGVGSPGIIILRAGASLAVMINSAIVRIVDFCARYRWTVIVAGTLLMVGAGSLRRRTILHQYRCRRIDFPKSALARPSTAVVPGLSPKRHFGRREGADRRECRTGHQRAGADARKESEVVSDGRATRQRRFLRAQRAAV